ncbi:outer membrane lipoprotein carrier protein LolA [Thiotrichales bacterium 19S3-7]|nr:outer membrane lipoprotein carrier protein LolA [Thiotrichales bacterium 19S3-7]MCF6802186.1 outer membrane lipoprotein carrier protein LolA [Thiotrichales bacterium 19S3-11]
MKDKYASTNYFVSILCWLFIGFCLTFNSAIAADINHLTKDQQQVFSQVKSKLASQKLLVGDFKQIRKIALLSSPLISSGNFELSKENGLKWYQMKPFKSSLIVTDTRISQTIGNNPATVIDKKDQPIVFAFTHIFLSLFQGDIELVKAYFKIDFSGSDNQWQVKLIPISSPLDKAIESILVSGGTYVSFIEVNQPHGDQMSIYFSNIKEK